VRFFIVRAHYRSPLNYSDHHLEDAKQALTRLYTALKGFDDVGPIDWTDPHAARFRDAMNDDFNTPEAVAVLFDLANELNRTRSARCAGLLRGLGGVLGLLGRPAEVFLRGDLPAGWTAEKIEQLITARTAAKKAKNFAEADGIRDQLAAAGIVLEDGPKGTTWRRS